MELVCGGSVINGAAPVQFFRGKQIKLDAVLKQNVVLLFYVAFLNRIVSQLLVELLGTLKGLNAAEIDLPL